MKLLAKLSIIVSILLLGIHLGCENSSTSPTPLSGSVKISLKSVYSGTAPQSMEKTAATVTISSARVVIDQIEFESDSGDSLDFEFEQPFVQDLRLDSEIHEIETIQVPFGTYEESEIKIDELNQEDGDPYTGNPELQDLSILIKGYVDNDPGQTFIFSSDLSAEQEREFDPPLVLDENSPSTNVVLTINLDTWFVDSNGDPIDPRSPDNRGIIEENIKKSIDVFEDEDDDGEDDSDDD